MGKRKVIPKGLKLFEYQKEGIKRLVKQDRTLLADVPGLGKTVQAIVATNIWESRDVFIVVPACVGVNWVREFTKWDTLGRSVCLYKGKKSLESFKNADVKIVSYASAHKVFTYIKKGSVLIADEFHKCKTWGKKRTTAVIHGMLPEAGKFIGITGTPMSKGIPCLHPLVSACNPVVFGGSEKFHKFCSEYSIPMWDGYQTVYRGVRKGKKQQLRDKLRTFMIRRYKHEVELDLPEKIFIEAFIDVPKNIRDSSLEYAKFILNSLTKGQEVSTSKSMGQCLRELGEAKVSGIIDYVDNMFEGGDKPAVIFTYHREVTKKVSEGLKKKGYKVGTIIGGGTDRQEVIDDFQAGKLDAAVLSIMAANVGVTLTKACNVVLGEYVYDPTALSQAIDRCHRIGQDRGVRVHFLKAKGSLDDRVVKILQEKTRVIESIVGSV